MICSLYEKSNYDIIFRWLMRAKVDRLTKYAFVCEFVQYLCMCVSYKWPLAFVVVVDGGSYIPAKNGNNKKLRKF